MEALNSMKGFIDKSREFERTDNKLGNPGFTDKVPSTVIDKEKAAEFARDITKLKDSRDWAGEILVAKKQFIKPRPC